MFIQTESTPNPATLKFLPGRPVMSEGALDLRDARAAEISPLGRALFAVDGVRGVLFGADFVAVTKDEGADWNHLKPAILGAIMEHFMTGAPLVEGEMAATQKSDEFYAPEDADTVAAIKDLLETRVRPAVAGDGGDIVFRGFEKGIVYLQMKGACSGCPSSTATLKHGIQNLLRHFLPDVEAVEQI